MKTNIFLKLQQKFAGKWVATDKSGGKVYASGKKIQELFKSLKKRNMTPTTTVIGYIQKKGQLNAYLSFSIQKD